MSQVTILIVEDDGIMAMYLEQVLTRQGYSVLKPVSSAEQAIRDAETCQPSIILMDIELGGEMNGIHAADRIAAVSDCPLVFMTGYSQDQIFQQAKVTSPYGYLIKPVPERELFATIEMALYKHQLDRQVKKSEARYRSLVEQAADGILLIDTRGVVLDINSAGCALLGYTREEILQRPWQDFTLPQPMLCAAAPPDSAENGDIFQSEVWMRRKDGSRRLVEIRSKILEDGSIQSIVRDIGERKQAEMEKELLIEISQLFLRSGSTDSIYQELPRILAQAFDFPLACVELYDSAAGEMVFVGSYGLPETAAPLRVPARQSISGTVAVTGQPLATVSAHQRPDHQNEVMVNLNARSLACSPFTLEGTVHGVLTLADTGLRPEVSSLALTLQIIGNHLAQELMRKRAEDALRRSEAQFMEAQKIARIGRWHLDLLSNHLTWSELIFELFEIDPNQFDASYDAFLAGIHPEDRATVHQAYLDSVKNHTTYEISHRLKMKDGRIKWVNEIGRTEYDSSGRALHSMGIVQDMTQLKQYEANQRQLQDRFTKAFHTSPDAININRLEDGLYLDINNGFTALTGFSAQDVDQKTSLEINVWADPQDRARLAQLLRQHGEVTNFEAPFRLKNGQIKYGLMSAKLIETNGDLCILSVTRDITERKQAEEQVLKSSEELRFAYDATLAGLSKALELRERETAGHSQRVVQLALDLGQALGICDEALVHLQRGALLHDIGKMGIPDSILMKPGPLSADEWVIMRQHPGYAYQLLSQIPYLLPALDIPYCHHERWDGTGYPRGLAGEEIPLAARIFAVVDVWDALLSDRPYRPAWPRSDAARYLREQAGQQFDPHIAETFLREIVEA